MLNKYKLCGIKAVKASGVVSFILTTRTVDRDGEVVVPSGVKLENFVKNPVFLWAHDLKFPPLGRVLPESIRVTEEEVSGDVQFDMADPFAKMIFEKYKKGFLNAGSIRFIPLETTAPILEGQTGETIKRWELLEYSAVPVPANQNALQKELVSDLDDERAKTWQAEVKSFLEDDTFDHSPQGWVEKLNKIQEDNNSNGDQASEPLINVIFDEEGVKIEDKRLQLDEALRFQRDLGEQLDEYASKELPPVITGLSGSFEWIKGKLTKIAKQYFAENKVDGIAEEDRLFVIGTFTGRAVLISVGSNRPLTEDPIFQCAWKFKNGVPLWTGLPQQVELTADVQEVAKQFIPFGFKRLQEPVLAPESEPWDKTRAGINRDVFAVIREHDGGGFLGWCPHHNLKGEVVWQGVAAEMINVVKNSTAEWTETERREAYEHLCRHYKDFDKEPPELLDVAVIQDDDLESALNELDDDQVKDLTEKVTQEVISVLTKR